MDPRVISDYISFFRGERNDYMLKYSYMIDDDSYEHLTSKCNGYYPCREEEELLRKNMDLIVKCLGNETNIFDIGPGSEQAFKSKILPIIRAHRSVLSYNAIDSSSVVALQTNQIANKYLPDLKIQVIVNSIGNLSAHDFSGVKGSKVLLFLGITIGNFDKNSINSFFTTIANLLNKDDRFIFSVDTNMNLESLKKAYFNKYADILFRNSLKYANLLFKNIDYKSGFEYQVNWNENTTSVEFLYKVMFNQSINIDNQDILIKEDSVLYVGKSKKFKHTEITEILANNKLEVVEYFHSINNMAIYICKCV